MKHIIALSGGKDSVSMGVRLCELYPTRDFQCVITPTGDELPEMESHWLKLSKFFPNIKKLPGKTLFDLIDEKNMLPNFRARWCTVELKINPMIDFLDNLDENSIMYVGLRFDEPGRFGMDSLDKKFLVKYPLREWGWGINEVLTYLDNKNIQIPKRTDCGCCFYQRLSEWKDLFEKYPKRYQRYVQLESKINHTFRSPSRDTWPSSLDNLRREFLSGRKLRKFNDTDKSRCRFCSM